jgi:hypothetical protein
MDMSCFHCMSAVYTFICKLFWRGGAGDGTQGQAHAKHLTTNLHPGHKSNSTRNTTSIICST